MLTEEFKCSLEDLQLVSERLTLCGTWDKASENCFALKDEIVAKYDKIVAKYNLEVFDYDNPHIAKLQWQIEEAGAEMEVADEAEKITNA